jgi:hypothetical protein
MHTEVEAVGDEVHTRSVMGMQIRRAEASVKINVDQRYRESRDGRPLAFSSVLSLGQEPVTMQGTINKGRLRLVQNQFGTKHESFLDFDPDIKFPWGLQLEQQRHGLAPGTTFTVKFYDPGIRVDGPFEVVMRVHEKEPLTLPDGQKRMLTKVTSTMQLQIPISSVSWVDDEANPLVMDMEVGGFTFRLAEATKEQALEGDVPPELFFKTFIEVEKKINPDARVVKLRLRLPSEKNAMKMPPLPNTAAQSVERVNDYEVVVAIRRLDWPALRKAEPKAGADQAPKEYLRASVFLDINDKRIKRHARRAVKDCRTPGEKADALRRYVTKFVESKSLDVGFATASEVIRTRKGDCSEHAVLLAAMARAAGLPARGVSGIVQIPPGALAPAKGSAFGYHMWTQVYIDGQWVDIDAALRQTDCDPTHVALVIMPLNDEGLGNSVLSLMPLLGRLQIEVLSVEEGPPKSDARP